MENMKLTIINNYTGEIKIFSNKTYPEIRAMLDMLAALDDASLITRQFSIESIVTE